MGALSDTVKHAEAAITDEWLDELMPKAASPVGEDPEAALTELAALMQRAEKLKPSEIIGGSEARTNAGLKSLRDLMPTSNEEAWQKGVQWAGLLGALGIGAGALSSFAGHRQQEQSRRRFLDLLAESPAMPRREMIVPFKTRRKLASEELDGIEKQGIWPYLLAAGLATPFAMKAMGAPGFGEMWGNAKDFGKELFTGTEDPLTREWVMPALFLAATGGVYGGKKIFDAVFQRMREKRKERERHWAEREFQSALEQQYSEAGRAGEAGVKYSSLGGAVNMLARAHVDGELYEQLATMEKRADPLDPTAPAPSYRGAGKKAVGLYLMIAAMLSVGGFAGMHALMKSRDTDRKKQEALEKALRRRAMATPPQFVVEPQAADEDEQAYDLGVA